MIKASFATQLDMTVIGSTQSAFQADGACLLRVVGERRMYFQRDGHSLFFEGLVVENLDSDVLAGILFMEKNDITIRPAKRRICLGDDVYSYGCLQTTMDRHAERRAHVLRAPRKDMVWPGEYIEVELPPELLDLDSELAIEPHVNAPRTQQGQQQWPAPALVRGVSGRIRLLNLTTEPQPVQKSEHLCRARATYVPATTELTIRSSYRRPAIKSKSAQPSSPVDVDPVGVMPLEV